MPVVVRTDRHGRQLLDIKSILFTQERLITLDGPITDESASEIVQQLLYLSTVSDDDITLLIDSPGGSVTAGLAIYDTICGLGVDVSTVCLGMAASMGAFLLAAGTKGKRYAMPHSEVMIHQVMGGAQGQAVDVQIAAHRIGRMKDDLNAMLSRFTGQPLDRIAHDTDRDYFMTAEEA
ncbi:MAG: ATP-dependent Clp protease proteolytic subunit, partial [Oscillospiraceae bacterium]|nr:ATP-dependent Clp protease proteolytic subunit [Oscillospiraceae bacterium]